MKKLVILASLLIAQQSIAQQIHVQKVKGNKAVIEFSGNLVPGKSYNIGGQSSNSDISSGSRGYIVGGSFSYATGKDETNLGSLSSNSSMSDMSLIARFGWNLETFEVGPVVSYRSIDSDYQAMHYSSMNFGGFGDYNFTPNRRGESSIFAVTGEATYGTYSPKGGTSGNALAFFAGGTLKWFGLGNATAFRTDLGYDYKKITIGSASVTSSGFGLRAGLATYF